MNANALTFIEDVNKLGITGDIANYMAVAAGIAVGRHLQLPATLLDGQDETYNNELLQCAREKVSCLNELSVFDTNAALCVAKGVYLVRFKAVFNDIIHISQDGCLWCDVFGISDSLGEVDISNLDKAKVVDLAGLMTSVIMSK